MKVPLVLFSALLAVSAPAATLTGLWEFDNAANPAQATVGNDLIFEGVAPAHVGSLADDGSNSLNGVITTAAPVNGNRIRADHGIAPNGGGGFVNQYSIVADIFSPVASRSSWRTIFQTNTGNANDGDYFIRPDNDHVGVGGLTYSGGPIDETSWTRLVLTVDLTLSGNDATAYFDGALHFTHSADPGVDGRFSLDPFLYFFTDDSGDNAAVHVGALAIYDGVLTPAEVASLGGAGRPIPEPSSALLIGLSAFLGLRRGASRLNLPSSGTKNRPTAMKVKLPNIFRFASMGLLGLAFAHSVHASVINHVVAEPSFGSAVAGGGQYSYASTAAWTNNNDTDDNWFYNTDYVNLTSDKRPLPRTGDVALHGLNGYTFQLLSDNFVAGRTYTFSVYASGDTDSDAVSDRHWMYIYDGATVPGVFTEGSELVRARYLRDGTLDSFANPVGTGAFSGTNPGWSIGDGTSTSWVNSGGTWGEISLSYTATAADDGKPIGIAMWGAGDAASDDVRVTSIPEPTLSMLVILSGGLLLRRRRR